ncbi:hypothetical protein M9Y10_012239 [Tritrichomonas musculus]|uniref:Uncharacterized protein n=1 Tax=Tritrichomonas musculus TaxID=1915356 RepID=A0ABR2IBZ1_9EUKA
MNFYRVSDNVFLDDYGTRITYNEERKTYSLVFSSRSSNVDPIEALKYKERLKSPITHVKYQHITYRVEGKDHLVIKGGKHCTSQISVKFMNILSIFPRVVTELKADKLYSIQKAVSKTDRIKKLTIKGNIRDLTFSLDDPKKIDKSPFKSVYFARPDGENPVPYKFAHLETIDLSECVALQKLWLDFIYNANVRTINFPDHDFEVYGNDWIKQHNDECDEDDQRIEVTNENHAKSSKESGGACNIA